MDAKLYMIIDLEKEDMRIIERIDAEEDINTDKMLYDIIK